MIKKYAFILRKILGLSLAVPLLFVAVSVQAQVATTTASVSGCTDTNGFSTSTGQMCNGTGSINPAMSTTTNTTTIGTFPYGCTSYNGFSPSTGESCFDTFPASTTATTTIVPISTSVTVTPTTTSIPTTSTLGANIPLCEIQRTLKVGSSGQDVKCLQRFLNYSGYTVATSGFGSPGNESTYYGPATANAVTRLQNANAAAILTPSGLSAGTGIFGQASFNFYVNLVINALHGQ